RLSIGCSAPFSVTSKSEGFSVSTSRPRASDAKTSIRTTRGVGSATAPPPGDTPSARAGLKTCTTPTAPNKATTRAARLSRSTGYAKPDQLLRFPTLAGRRDFDDVLAWRKTGERQLDLLIELRGRSRRHLQVGHR